MSIGERIGVVQGGTLESLPEIDHQFLGATWSVRGT